MNQTLIEFRRFLHKYPEVSGSEVQTALKIKTQLEKITSENITSDIGGHGMIMTFDSGKEGKHILFRADMDALPIQEANDFPHRSTNEGVSHKCGHDGHSTMLVGLAQRLSQSPISTGKVTLLFQPAEETGEGAKSVLDDQKFSHIRPDYVFALHNIPGYPKGLIICKPGTFNPAVISFCIKLYGKKSHAGEPEKGINPNLATAKFITELDEMNHFDIHSEDYFKSTMVHVKIGSQDYGSSPGNGEIHYTIRCKTKERLEKAQDKIKGLIQDICQNHQLSHSIEWLHYFASTTNDIAAVNLIKEVAAENAYQYHAKDSPFEWGEDFGLFTESTSGAMFGLGAGKDTPDLHQVDYDFPDEIMEYGINMFYCIALKVCS